MPNTHHMLRMINSMQKTIDDIGGSDRISVDKYVSRGVLGKSGKIEREIVDTETGKKIKNYGNKIDPNKESPDGAILKFIEESQKHPFFSSMPKRALEETYKKMYN